MNAALELHDSRVCRVTLVNGTATVYFSHAYIHKSPGKPGSDPGTGWSQEARLVLASAQCSEQSTALPNTISDGYLEVGGIRHDLIPLPFSRHGQAKLALVLSDGSSLEVSGERPAIELLGDPKFLEDVT